MSQRGTDRRLRVAGGAWASARASRSATVPQAIRATGVHLATVAGPVSPLDPDRIAEQCVRLARQPADQWEDDVLFDGVTVK
ncbi:hypothetical protein ACIQU6_18865 [Streptomyces sp. NPDC090442]|uniref:hypothetical protein n=1 Tax=Streptomyces sp. NPDC090442 TaxID=3365962 RepID=UPI0037F71396